MEILLLVVCLRLSELDSLFIRDTIYVNHYPYRFSRQTMTEGLIVFDDPDSILKYNNKVYLAELLARHQIPTPKALLVHDGNICRIVPMLELLCVLEQSDSIFAQDDKSGNRKGTAPGGQ